MKKKFVTFITLVMICVMVVGCGNSKGESEKTDSANKSSETAKSSKTEKVEKIVLKIGNAQKETHPWNGAINEMTKLASEYSDGRLVIENYPNATLGTESEMLESVKNGTLDMVVTDPTVGTTFCKELELFSLPFIFSNVEHRDKVLNGEIGKEYADLIEEKSGIKILGYWGGVERNVISTKKPVESIDDLQGFKLRLAPSELKFKVWEAVGALPVTIAFGETYSALQSGVCDGMENEMPSILSAKFYEPAPNFTMTGHEITVRPLFMNSEKFNSLDKELQEALIKSAEEATKFAVNLEREAADKAKNEMVEKYGIQIYEINKTPIMERTADIFKEFGNATGTTDIINEIAAVK